MTSCNRLAIISLVLLPQFHGMPLKPDYVGIVTRDFGPLIIGHSEAIVGWHGDELSAPNCIGIMQECIAFQLIWISLSEQQIARFVVNGSS